MNSGGGKALTEEYIFKMIRKQKHYDPETEA